MARIRIADDPQSWGKPQTSTLGTTRAGEDAAKCYGCGVAWINHMADLCPIMPQRSRKAGEDWR
jgi:hypothetical protein